MNLSKLNTRLAKEWYEKEVDDGVAPQEDFNAYAKSVEKDKEQAMGKRYLARRFGAAACLTLVTFGGIEIAPKVVDTMSEHTDQIIEADNERFLQEYGPDAVPNTTNNG